MSPILVRPVREQLEHDRVIRLLQAKYKRKFEVAINPGNEQAFPVGTGPSPWYPDLVLQSTERARKLLGIVEVETAESVNHLEAMSQWVALSRMRAPFHLYIPAGSIDSARRLCTDHQVTVAEMWAYHSVGDQLRFTLVQRTEEPGEPRSKTTPTADPVAPRSRATSRPAAAPARAAAAPRAAKQTRVVPNSSGRRALTPARRVAGAVGNRKAVKPKATPARRATAKPATTGKPAARAVRPQKRK